MGTNYPGGTDVFVEPNLPEETSLSSAGDGTRNHVEHHRDLGDAVEALEGNASLKTHDHSGVAGTAHGSKLDQANTHQNADTDTGTASLHHSLGTGGNQAAAGNHRHDYSGYTGSAFPIFNKAFIRCTHATRPTGSERQRGLVIIESDTLTIWIWTGSEWIPLLAAPDPAPPIAPAGGGTAPPPANPYISVVATNPQTISPTGSIIEFNGVNSASPGGMGTLAGAPGGVSAAAPASGGVPMGSVNTITAPQSGTYVINGNVQWDPSIAPSQGSATVYVNGQPTYIQNSTGLVGNGRTPGYSQSTPVFGSIHLNAGDTVQLGAGYTPNNNSIGGIINTFAHQPTNALSSLSVAYVGG